MEKEYSTKYLQINRDRTVLYDGKETPFFSIKPELSDLAESKQVANYFNSRYEALNFSRACIADGGIIIQNVASKQSEQFLETAKDLNLSSSITLQIVDSIKTTKDMFSLLSKSEVISSETLLVFPGNGSQDILNIIEGAGLELPDTDNVKLETKRTMIKNGTFSLSVDYSPLPKKQYENAVIIDDVVASGQTAQEIAYDLGYYYPGMSINVATWLILPPSNPRNIATPSGIPFIDQTFASIALKGNYLNRPPINSLSMFLSDDEISLQKRTAYKNKYILDPQQFDQTLAKLRELK